MKPKKKKQAFVLSGGGSRGAMQVGALRALWSAGYRPDMVTGTSIGAVNGAFLAVHGFNEAGLEKLEQVWLSTVDQDLLPANLWWQTMRAFFKHSKNMTLDRVREFAIAHGLTSELRFADLRNIELFVVAADLNKGSPVIFGLDPQASVLESMLASMALPPWITPAEVDGRYLIDGGAVSNLPVEAALLQGASEIIALDLFDTDEIVPASTHRLGDFFFKLEMAVENRQRHLEMALAEARGVPVRRIALIGEQPVPLWDFRNTSQLIARGQMLAEKAIAGWQPVQPRHWWQKLEIKARLKKLIPERDRRPV